MLTKVFLFLISSSILFFCTNNKGAEIKSTKNEDSSNVLFSDSGKFIETLVQDSGAYYSKISNTRSIEIVSVRKVFDTASKFLKRYKGQCESWNLNKNQILNILVSSNEIDGQEFHHYYDVLPCWYSGEFTLNRRLVSFEINAGSFTVLYFKDTSIYLGYEKSDYKKYFLLGPGVD